MSVTTPLSCWSHQFATITKANILIKYIPKEDVISFVTDTIKNSWVNSTTTTNDIKTAPGTQNSHMFVKFAQYEIKHGLHSFIHDDDLVFHDFMGNGNAHGEESGDVVPLEERHILEDMVSEFLPSESG